MRQLRLQKPFPAGIFCLCASLLLLAFLLQLAACSNKDIHAPSLQEAEKAKADFDRHLNMAAFQESQEPYVSGRLVARKTDSLDTPLMRTKVALRQKGTLEELAASVARLAPVSARVADFGLEADGGGSAQPAKNPAPEDSLLPDDFLPLASAPSSGLIDINYSGTLRGLLDAMATLSGYGWDYEEKTASVTFSAMQVRTFVLSALTGQVSWEAKVSNKSRNTKASSQSGSNINATVTSGDSSSETAQVNTSKTALDIWKDAEKSVRALLSKAGSVTVNQSSGTITVRDTYARMRQIERCINEMNARLERQVALRVHIYAVEVSDSSDFNLGLKALFTSPDVIVEGGSSAAAASGLAGVSILKGSLTGSGGFLQALKKWGRATQLTSASGLVLNNQPFPVQAIRRHAYLAGMTRSTTQYDQSTEITPGEVTTGFAMTIVPHILPDSHVLLQYNVTLSSLESMTTIDKDSVYVQLPQVSTRAFSQRTRLKNGQTLMLAGFEQDSAKADNSFGLLSLGRSGEGARTLLIISIELQGADNV